MSRRNGKVNYLSFESSIKKSNELSMGKLSRGLTLNQMQLLAYTIFSTQQDGKTEFHKSDFEKRFSIKKYPTVFAKEDALVLLDLKFSTGNIEEDKFEFWNVFRGIKYDEGLFIFKWNDDFVPHILELKEKYVTTDLTVTSNFSSGFSWTLYDYLRGHYGYWRKEISKEELLKLFNVENKKSYSNTALFKRSVLDLAISEINMYTELDIHYTEKKQGRKIVGFNLIWSKGKNVPKATKAQINNLSQIIKQILDDAPEVISKIQDQECRDEALEIISSVREMRPHINDTVSITFNRADILIKEAKNHLSKLHSLPHSKRHIYYNWLEDAE